MVRLAATATPVPRSSLGLLWGYARPHLRTLIFALMLGLASSALALITPLVTKWILDSLADGASLTMPILLLVALLISGTVVSWWEWVTLGTMAEKIVYTARTDMIARFLRARVFGLLKLRTGELVTRVTSDSVLLREAASSSVLGLLNGVVMLVGSVILMAVLDLTLMIATVITIALVVVMFVILMPGIAKSQERSQEALGELGGSLEGALRAIKTVKAAGAELRQRDSLGKNAADSRDHSISALRREALVWSIAFAGVQGAIIVILGLGAWRITTGEMDVSTLVAFLLYAFGLVEPITSVSQDLSTLQSGIAAARRIREIESIELEPEDSGIAPAATVTHAPVIELRGVTAGYEPDAPPAVRNVDLAIPGRCHVALVGPSGAGKTSILSLILRFLKPDAGQLLLHGVPYDELPTAEIRSRLAYVEQETPVVPGTIRDNLLFISRAATAAEVDDVLAKIHLTEVIEQLPLGLDTPLSDSSVSGGQRQRIALARALLARPEVLLLDEATAQVDGITEAAIHDAIAEQARTGTVITIAHRLSTVIDADQIIVLADGEIVARGTHAELVDSNTLYRRLVEALRISSAVDV